jgi:antitoxin (DNA-binding transcriptional repressor) of toxin-antitoxin stability system
VGVVDPAHDPSVAAEQARARLHEEIERVRSGVEEMLTEHGSEDAGLRRELDAIREETRAYVRKRVAKVEKRTDKRLGKLERRLDRVEADRKYAEWRIHTNTEAMLDGLLREVRAIADLLTRPR